MTRTRLSGIAATICFGLLLAPGTAWADKDCADFAYQEDAQAYYVSLGGPAVDPDRLDGNDNDGQACESLPHRPTASPAVPVSPPTSPAPAPAMTQAAPANPVLGIRGLMGPYGKGWGIAKPRTIFNGAVPSVLFRRITWKGWGKSSASGRGVTRIYKPRGGSYAKPGAVKLRATGLGTCDGKPTYRRLYVQVVKKPGGRFGRRFSWSGRSDLCDPAS